MILQHEFFELIMARKESKGRTVEEVADVLHVGVSAVRKMMQGQTELSYERMRKLIDHFKIRPEELFTPRKNLINATYVSLDAKDPDNYLRYINGLLAAVTAAADDPESRIMFAADEIPIFHFMRSKRLTYFKLYCYGYSMHKYDYKFEDMEKVFDELGLMEKFEQIVTQYDKMHSIEIWDDYILDTLFDQISFIESVDGFKDKTTIGELIDDILGLLQYVENLCGKRVKSGGGSFGFYRKPSRISPGYMLTETGVGRHLNLKVASINSLSFWNQKLAQEMNSNFGTALDMSTALAMGAKRERRIYFKKLQTRISVLRTKKTTRVLP